MHIINTISRRQFLAATGAITGTALLNPLTGMKAEAANVMAPKASKKLRLAMVGTGIRGTTMWGRDLIKAYPDYMEFVNEGYSKMGIAKRLNQMGEPNPVTYKKKKGLRYNNPNSGKNDGLWSAATIARILQNKIYTGAMVQGRHRVISYKVHKQISVPEDEWYIVPNTHEAIIDRATFEKAQALHTRDTSCDRGFAPFLPAWQ